MYTRVRASTKTHAPTPKALPTTLGIEGSGIIETVGAEVSQFRTGDRVAYCLCWGSYAEYAVVPAWRVAPVPDDLPLELAAASLFHGLTAHYLAYDLGKLGPGVTCLVHAALGGIGQVLVQLAARLGAAVYATTSTDEKAEVARARGATAAFLYEDGRFADDVRNATNVRGVDVVFDAVGKPTFRDRLRATRLKRLVVSYGSVGGAAKDLDPIELGEKLSPRMCDPCAALKDIFRGENRQEITPPFYPAFHAVLSQDYDQLFRSVR